MAKVPYSKLRQKQEPVVYHLNYQVDDKTYTIEVKKHLPFSEKCVLVYSAIEASFIDDTCYDPVILEVVLALKMVMSYSNISFTDKQLSNPYNLYDELDEAGILGKVISTIPAEEISFYETWVDKLLPLINQVNISSVAGMRTSQAKAVDMIKQFFNQEKEEKEG